MCFFSHAKVCTVNQDPLGLSGYKQRSNNKVSVIIEWFWSVESICRYQLTEKTTKRPTFYLEQITTFTGIAIFVAIYCIAKQGEILFLDLGHFFHFQTQDILTFRSNLKTKDYNVLIGDRLYKSSIHKFYSLIHFFVQEWL